jgi:lipoate-protein ligase A
MNLALEEYCLRNLDSAEDYLLFYVNAPSVIIGKHQNPIEECNLAYIQNNDIHLVRRISGGGAVYHDHGNLNFSFITGFQKEKLDYFKKLIQPILRALHQLGVRAELTHKNNIVVQGKKVSGNSQYTNVKRMLSHGTLLFDSDLEVLKTALKSKMEVIHSKAVQSEKSEVVNISDYTEQPASMVVYLEILKAAISKQFGPLNNYKLSAEDWDAIYRLAGNKYKSWEWTHAKSPDFVVRHHIKHGSEQIEYTLHVKRGVIEEIAIQDSASGNSAINDLKSKFLGERYAGILSVSQKEL